MKQKTKEALIYWGNESLSGTLLYFQCHSHFWLVGRDAQGSLTYEENQNA